MRALFSKCILMLLVLQTAKYKLKVRINTLFKMFLCSSFFVISGSEIAFGADEPEKIWLCLNSQLDSSLVAESGTDKHLSVTLALLSI